MFWLGFLLGVFVGTCLGALLIAVCTAAAMADHHIEQISHKAPETLVERDHHINESKQP
jgi:ABC-type nitrate/sulfonate/bicarbonate transport system permease component